MSINKRTMATIRQLEDTDWFAHTGHNDLDAVILSSWDEAIEHCTNSEWENLRLEMANQYCERLVERSPERFSKWNDIVLMLKPAVIPFVQRKIAPFVQAFNLPKIFENSVQWDILHLCMEAEYADVFPPSFYSACAFYYSAGHFPCGWAGDFPKGRPVIF